jgi:hypothetical protein
MKIEIKLKMKIGVYQQNLMFVGKAKSLSYSGALKRCIAWVDSGLTHKH